MLDESLTAEAFWNLLESSGRSLSSLCRKLEGLSQRNLQLYQRFYEETRRSVDPYFDWEESSPHILKWDSLSEDDAEDFSAWVIMQGQDFYEQVRNHPDLVQHYIDLFQESERGLHPELRWDNDVDRDEYRGYQGADSIAYAIHRTRFAKDMPR